MQKKFKRTLLLLVFSLKIFGPTFCLAGPDVTNSGGWDYYGSGRDHGYSNYVDNYNHMGYDSYTLINSTLINDPYNIKNGTTPAAATASTLPGTLPPDEFIVNIPNSHGGYSSVVIKRSGSGFIGPLGEYYPEFPKKFQLEMKYGT